MSALCLSKLIALLPNRNIRPEDLGFGHAIYLNSHTHLRVIHNQHVNFLISSKLNWDVNSLSYFLMLFIPLTFFIVSLI